jgi:prepilin-type N-terminal cleavage/methylation domain-containing protein
VRLAPPAARTRRGFTLIEILAVVAILALAALLVTPNLNALRERRLRSSADRLAAELELARQRAVVTGIPHRVLFDIESGVYRIEWLGGDGALPEEEPVPAGLEYDLRGSTQLPLAAPQTTALEYSAVPDSFGNFRELEGGVFVAGLETAEGWVESGFPGVVFERDGSAAWTEIVLAEEGGERLGLAVLPLDDAVRFVELEPAS